MLTILILLTLLFSYIGADLIRRELTARRMFNLPNERTSHQVPTPRGGGIAIAVLSVFGLLAYAWYTEMLSLQVLSYALAASLVALVSWLDDVRSLPNRMRFAVHVLAALIVLAGIGSWSTVYFLFWGILGIQSIGLLVTFVWIVGLINAYNFMDGIDGIAGSQAVVAGLGWALLGWWSGQSVLLALGLLIAASSLGFLGQNWHPACIFMGDVGSTFLGFSFASMSILAVQQDPLPGILFLWPFLFDTLFTITRRFQHGENIFQPHRSHLYQRLVIAGYRHSSVTLLYSALTLLTSTLGFCWYLHWLDEWPVVGLLALASFALWGFVRYQEFLQTRQVKPTQQLSEKWMG